MPEVAEVCVLSQYLMMKLRNKMVVGLDVLSGKYADKKVLKGGELLKGPCEYEVVGVDSKGKLMWLVLKRGDNIVWLTSHLGLAGEWSFYKGKNDRIRLSIKDGESGKSYRLYYNDPRNFGNVEILDDSDLFNAKIARLAPDVLKTNFSGDAFIGWIGEFLNRSKKRKDMLVHSMMMEQTVVGGIVSGLGNYLTPEILYDAKISPFRTVGSLTDADMRVLAHSMKYIVKMTYYWGTTGYMSKFDDFLEAHRKGIDEGKYPNFHPEIRLDENKKFEFRVYGKKFDPDGNVVDPDKTIDPKRTTYWVPAVQK